MSNGVRIYIFSLKCQYLDFDSNFDILTSIYIKKSFNMLNNEEIIAQSNSAYLNILRHKTVYHWKRSWWRINIAKWFSINTWWMNMNSERQEYYEKTSRWTLTFTKNHITFVCNEKSLKIPVKSVIDITPYSDWIRISDWKNTYLFWFADDWVDFYNKVISYLSPWTPLLEHVKESARTKFRNRYKEADRESRHRLSIIVIFLLLLFLIWRLPKTLPF